MTLTGLSLTKKYIVVPIIAISCKRIVHKLNTFRLSVRSGTNSELNVMSQNTLSPPYFVMEVAH